MVESKVIGAAVTLDVLLDHPYLDLYPSIKQAIRGINSMQLQCQGTLGGEQKKKMLAAFVAGGPRASLVQSKGLNKPWLEGSPDDDDAIKITLYPNPATAEITVKSSIGAVGKTIFVINSNGVTVQAIPLKSAVQKINLTMFKAGLYFVRIEGMTEKFIKL